jgi:transposase
MSQNKIYYRETTFQQRRYLFELINESGNVSKACKQAKVSRGTYYYWKKRYEKDGIEGLREPESRSPHNHYTIDLVIEKRIVNLKRQHQNWGKKRIAQWIWKENNWEKVVAIETVKNVLERHGLWSTEKNKKFSKYLWLPRFPVVRRDC